MQKGGLPRVTGLLAITQSLRRIQNALVSRYIIEIDLIKKDIRRAFPETMVNIILFKHQQQQPTPLEIDANCRGNLLKGVISLIKIL